MASASACRGSLFIIVEIVKRWTVYVEKCTPESLLIYKAYLVTNRKNS